MMRPLALAASIVVLVATAFFAGGFPIVAPSRLHVHCEPPTHAARPLNPSRWIDRQHLRNDVEFAEEIGVRFGDSRRKAEGRDGEHLRQRECTDALLAAVAIRHNVAIEDLSAMRGERPVAVDAILLIVFGAVFVWFTSMVVDQLSSRLSDLQPWIWQLSVVVLALATAGAGLVALNLLATTLEIARLWDGHMSYRAGRLPWERHFEWVLAAGFTTFCITAWSSRFLNFAFSTRDDRAPGNIV
jgi:hypothetical protein